MTTLISRLSRGRFGQPLGGAGVRCLTLAYPPILGLAAGVLARVIAPEDFGTGPYPLAGIVWGLTCLGMFTVGLNETSDALLHGDVVRFRLLTGGRASWERGRWMVGLGTLLGATLGWFCYVLASGVGYAGPGALAVVAVAALPVYVAFYAFGLAVGCVFRGPHLIYMASGIALILVAYWRTPVLAILTTPGSLWDRLLAASLRATPVWWTDQAIGLAASGRAVEGLGDAGVAAVFALAGALIATMALRWTVGRQTLGGAAIPARRRAETLGY